MVVSTTPLALRLELAACLLACQLERYSTLTEALLAYHTDPDGVAGSPCPDPEDATYVERVTATLAWLCRTRPWRRWADRSTCTPEAHDPPVSPDPVYTYEVLRVAGPLFVPQDMLRYDEATVVTSGPGRATLVSPYPPTVARWASFGWRVIGPSDRRTEAPDDTPVGPIETERGGSICP
jgi:hypothetical protein